MVFKRMLKRRKTKVRQNINLYQNKQHINIMGKLGKPSYRVRELWLTTEKDMKGIRISNSLNNHEFSFDVNLSNFPSLIEHEEAIYRGYLIVNIHERDLTEKQIIKLKKRETVFYYEETGIYEYPIRLGRFENTYTEEMIPGNINGVECSLYKTVKGNISLSINKTINQENKVQIDNLTSKKNIVILQWKLYTRTERIEHISILVHGRQSNTRIILPINIKLMEKETIKKFGLNRYRYYVKINLNELVSNHSFTNDVYDFYFQMKYKNRKESSLLRIGNPRYKARRFLRTASGKGAEQVFSFSPYYTVKRFNLSFQTEAYNTEVYEYLKKVVRWSWLLRIFYRRKNIWIVGERPYKAQDTGYRLFKYIREKYTNKNCYYVIESDSPELKNVESLGNVLFYKSKKHVLYTLMARRVISSHHPDYLYPLRSDEFMKRVKAKKVFIQHGVLGTKNLEHFYSKNSPSFSTDLFLVSSELEKNIVVNDFDYRSSEVVITGLSRFDNLFEKDIETKRQLLIIPTWREWLVRDDVFLESEYYKRYKELVFNEELHQLSRKNNFEIVFCLHPNMQKYSPYFQSAPVRVINQGEVDVQDLLKASAMMITDYSSVAFDFSFLNKPVVYYQFDRKRFIGAKGSHLDLDNDLPGDIAFTLQDVINGVENYSQNNFMMKNEKKERAKRFLKYKDQESSERIVQEIESKVPKKPIHIRVMETEFYRTLFKRFRKSTKYFPTMKKMYNVMRKVLSVDDKLILFESGVGKQYADSPKEIYEEIIKRNLDYRIVWVCNNNIRLKDVENTKRIKRLSPSYYYYLAKAKYWINNQNLPTYIQKRPQTTYLQTWHGTPLKKMLHDIDNVMGRSDDYVERVSQAVQTWDYLISPSAYATEAFKSAFQYDGDILEIGYPRNDVFYKENRNEIAQKVRSRLHIPKNKKVILYAPTFRDNQATRNNRFTFNIEMDLFDMQKELGEEYIILLRMHVAVTNKLKLDEELDSFVFDVSRYSDMQELLLITDILITDYSSVMFDFANTKRPMLFFTFDLETYRDDVRGFYMDFEEKAPGPLLKNTDEIIEHVKNIDEMTKQYQRKYEDFYQKYCYLEDGNATKRATDILLSKNR